MTRPIVTIRTGEYRSAFLPACSQSWISTSIPRQQSQTVIRRPAVARRVRKVGLAAVVQGRGAFHNGATVLFPGVGRGREDLCGADFAGSSHRRNAEGLEIVRHARPDEVVAPGGIETDDAAVDAPGGG
jgi:hypothetical protein